MPIGKQNKNCQNLSFVFLSIFPQLNFQDFCFLLFKTWKLRARERLFYYYSFCSFQPKIDLTTVIQIAHLESAINL